MKIFYGHWSKPASWDTWTRCDGGHATIVFKGSLWVATFDHVDWEGSSTGSFAYADGGMDWIDRTYPRKTCGCNPMDILAREVDEVRKVT